MSTASIMPGRLDWPSTVGNFLLNFGMLEYLVNVYLKDHLDPAEYLRVKEWHLKDRLSQIEQYLNGAASPAQVRQKFRDFLVKLDPIRELRNHIAHGYMIVTLNLETQAPEILISVTKDLDQEFAPGARRVSFDELRTSLAELTRLIERFKAIVGFKELA